MEQWHTWLLDVVIHAQDVDISRSGDFLAFLVNMATEPDESQRDTDARSAIQELGHWGKTASSDASNDLELRRESWGMTAGASCVWDMTIHGSGIL